MGQCPQVLPFFIATTADLWHYPIMNRKTHNLLLATVTIALMACTSWAEGPYWAKVVKVIDGDTITVIHNKTQIKIRLYGIDTPERGQAFGNSAKKFTAEQVSG